MTEFRLTQISDAHLSRHLPGLTANFHRVCEHIDANRPDLVINTGDLAYDVASEPDGLRFARELHDALPVPCRCLPGNHDIGDNPTLVGAPPAQPASEVLRQNFIGIIGEDRWQFEAAGWCFIGLNSMIMNSGLAAEAEQFEWLAALLARTRAPIALFLHKPLFLDRPDDPELPQSAVRYVPQPARRRLVEMIGSADVRLVASGHLHQDREVSFGPVRHVWAPSTGFIIPDRLQPWMGTKSVGLVEYRFRPGSVEVRHVRAAGQVDIGMDELFARGSNPG